MLERESGRCLIYLVPNRQMATIFPIIGHHINNDSLLITHDFFLYVNNRRMPKISRITQNFPAKNWKHRLVDHFRTIRYI